MKTFPVHYVSLYWRLLWVSLSSILLVWCLLLGWFYLEVTKVGSGHFDRDLRSVADTIAMVHSGAFKEAERSQLIKKKIDHFSRSYSDAAMPENEFSYRVMDQQGRVLKQSANWPGLAQTSTAELPQRDGAWRSLMVSSEDAELTVQVAIEESFVQRATFGILIFFLLPLLLALPVMLLLLQYGFRLALKPVTLLANAIRNSEPKQTQPLVSNASHYKELAPVFEAVNSLLLRLAAHREAERRFFADAAHELRTPLAALGAQVHLLKQAENANQRAVIADMLQTSIERNAELVGKILVLSRLEAESAQANLQVFNLAALARAAVARNAPHAIARGSELSYDGISELRCCGDPLALESLFDNLIDNAIRHCPPGATISVEVEDGVSFCRISVLDDGPGIAPAWREEVLKRFVRLPDTLGAGSGLGLAIVQKVVDLHGGTLLLGEGLRGRGLGVEIRLPPIDCKRH
ncbi:HAMP domain-containing sensor histidine kinase [Massilia sp. W12]|uniref:sensor histidine kinase n=1 Tax=Massilia sp. W12 TaxID=3126507 RepID=UPI0030D154F0